MTEQQEAAMRQALEALEESHPEAYRHIIAALRQALEQPVQIDPSAGTQVSKVWWDGDKLMAQPIPLESIYKEPEQPAQGCDHCNHPLYAGTKCKNCGRVTEQPAIKQSLTTEQPAYRAVKTFHEGKPVYVAEQPAQKPAALTREDKRALTKAKFAQSREAQQELEELTAQRDQLADILTRTANALKGQPAELAQHSWHDLPEVAQKLMEKNT